MTSVTQRHTHGFSIIIANYNYAGLVGEALETALEQLYPQELFEVIVVDDGSTDHSLDVIAKFGDRGNLRVISQPNLGQAAAFFAGAAVAKHDWLCLLDSDDGFKPEKLARVDEYLRSVGNRHRFICHDVEVCDESRGSAYSWFKHRNLTRESLAVDQAGGGYPFANPCGQIYHKSLLQALAPWLDLRSWKRGADNPLVWGALMIAGRVGYLHEQLAVYRIHANNYFMGSGLVAKMDWLERWPALIEFLEYLHQGALTLENSTGDRQALLKRLRAYVGYWQQRSRLPGEHEPLVSIITTCKNRLHHLKQSLPRMVRQSRSEVIVVDYGCTQGTTEWVKQSFPAVKVVSVDDDPGWNAARARNAGAAAARSPWLLFIDADVLLEGDLCAWLATQGKESVYYQADPMPTDDAKGTSICRSSDYAQVGGYDEAYRGWSPEAGDFYAALRAYGVSEAGFPASFIRVIQHGDAERQLGGDNQVASRAQGMRVSLIYRTMKNDIQNLTGALPPLETRRAMMEHIIGRVKTFEQSGMAKDAAIRVVVNEGLEPYEAINISRVLTYTMRNLTHVFKPQVEQMMTKMAIEKQVLKVAKPVAKSL